MLEALYQRRRVIASGAVVTAGVLTLGFVFVPAIAGALALASTWVWTALLVILSNLEGAERSSGRLLSWVSWANSALDRAAVANEVQGAINGARKEIAANAPDVFPHPAKVKFIRNQSEVVDLQDGVVVVAMKQSRNHAENVARATVAYVSEAAIRPARPYVDPRALRSIDFSLAKRVLSLADAHALDYLIQIIWPAAVAQDPELGDLCHKIEVIEHEGLLARVLLAEFTELGRRLYGQFPPPGVQESTLHLVDLLYRLATKRRGEEIGSDLNFRHGHIRLGVVLVGEREKVETLGVTPYMRVVMDQARSGCDTVYLLARGKRKPMLAAIVRQLGGHQWFRSIAMTEYRVARSDSWVEVSCARLTVNRGAIPVPGSTSRQSSWRKGNRARREAEQRLAPVRMHVDPAPVDTAPPSTGDVPAST